MAALTVAEVIAELGITQEPDEDIILAVIDDAGVRHYRLPEIAASDVTSFPSLYLASGSFLEGTVSRTKGRTGDNVVRLYWLPFDCDLPGYLGYSKDRELRAAEIADLHQYDDGTLLNLIDAQRQDVEAAFAAIGLPIHRLDYTGYGLCAYVRLTAEAANNVGAARELHKAIIGRLNAVYPNVELVDRQASDAGTRITRLPESVNRKDGQARRVRTLDAQPGAIDLMQLNLAAKVKTERATVTPLREIALPEADVAAIVAALADSWTLGQKHAMGLAVAGIFAKAGMPEAQALTIIQQLSAGDDKPWDRENAVRRSYERARSGLSVKGFTSLAELIPPDALAFVDRTLDKIRQASTARILVSPERVRPEDRPSIAEKPAPPKFSLPPAIAFRGWFGEYRDLMSPTTEAPDAFHLGASFVLAGSLLGRRAWTYLGDQLFANLYVVLVGPTGQSRKDTAMSRAMKLPAQFPPPIEQYSPRVLKSGPEFWITHDVTSAEGIIQILTEHPILTLYITEFSMLLRRARRQSTSTLLTMLIKLWDSPPFVDHPTVKGALEARDVFLSILTATTPDTLAVDMTSEEIASGYANRHLFFPGTGIGPKADPPRVDPVRAQELMDMLRAKLHAYDGVELVKDAQATERFIAWYNDFYCWDHKNDDESAMVQRLPANIHKLALLYATVDGDSVIRLSHFEAALAVAEWSWDLIKRELDRWGQVEEARTAERILAVLERKGPISRRGLQQSIGRKLGPGNFARTLDSLAKNGEVMIGADGTVAGVFD